MFTILKKLSGNKLINLKKGNLLDDKEFRMRERNAKVRRERGRVARVSRTHFQSGGGCITS